MTGVTLNASDAAELAGHGHSASGLNLPSQTIK